MSKAGTAIGTIQVENKRVRVTEWRFPYKGDDTGWHQHAHDYVVVPLFDGILNIESDNGEIVTSTLRHGIPYFRKAGVKHNVMNGNDFECVFIETELLE